MWCRFWSCSPPLGAVSWVGSWAAHPSKAASACPNWGPQLCVMLHDCPGIADFHRRSIIGCFTMWKEEKYVVFYSTGVWFIAGLQGQHVQCIVFRGGAVCFVVALCVHLQISALFCCVFEVLSFARGRIWEYVLSTKRHQIFPCWGENGLPDKV